MGKTFRRGGSERGNYSFGKSIRDKRQRGQNRSTTQGNYYESISIYDDIKASKTS